MRNDLREHMQDKWFYSESGEQRHGPMSIQDLGIILSNKNNSEQFFVWYPGMPNWARAGDIDELRAYLRPPPIPETPPPLIPETLPPPIPETPREDSSVPSAGKPSHLYPWRRFFARWVDIYLFLVPFFVLLGITFPTLFLTNQSQTTSSGHDYIYTIVGLAAYAIFETFCLNVFGGTFGKFLYGIRVAPRNARQFDLSLALKRSLAVWARGLGFGIPIVSLITLFVGYKTLTKEGQTSWDRDFNCIVIHSELSPMRWFLIAIVWLLVFLIYATIIAITSH